MVWHFATVYINQSTQRTCRNYYQWLPKASLYTEIVCRQWEEEVRDESQPHVDTSPTPICPLLPHEYTCWSIGTCRGVSLTTKVSVEVQVKSSHLPWARMEQTTQKINLEIFFNIYWTSKVKELTVSGQSWHQQVPCSYLMEKHRGCCDWGPYLLSRITLLCKCWCMTLRNSHCSQLTMLM